MNAVKTKILYLISLVFLIAPVSAQAACNFHNINGFIWSYAIGWISLSCQNTGGGIDYGLDINFDLDPDAPVVGYGWSPNGAALLVDKSDLFVKDRRLLVADPATGATRVLRRETDPNNVSAEWWADWAPDGKGVYYTSDRDEDYHVYHQPLDGGTPSRVTSGAWAVFRAEVSAGASQLVLVTNEGRAEERHLATVPLRGGEALPWRLQA